MSKADDGDALSIFRQHLQTRADIQSLAEAGLAAFGGPAEIMRRLQKGCDAADAGSMAHQGYLRSLMDIITRAGDKRNDAPAGAEMDNEQIESLFKQLLPRLGTDAETRSRNPAGDGPGTD